MRRLRPAAFRLAPAALTALILAGLLPACGTKKSATKRGKTEIEKIPVRVEVLRPRRYVRRARAVSTVEPWRSVTLRAEVPGRVLQLLKGVGDPVQPKERLAQIDGSVAWRAYQTSAVGIDQAKVALRLAEQNLRRAKRLERAKAIAKVQLEATENAYERAKVAMALARARSTQALTRMGQFSMTAPFAGVIAKRPVEVGDYVGPGASVFTIVEVRRVKVVAGLAPRVGLALSKGDAARVTVRTIKGRLTRAAKIHLVRPLADPRTRRIEVELEVDNRGGLLKPGMIAQIEVPLGRPTQKLLVPADALTKLLGQHYVWIVHGGRARRVPVALGVTTRDRVEIRPTDQGALPDGTKLVTLGHQRLYANAPVHIAGETNPPAEARLPHPK